MAGSQSRRPGLAQAGLEQWPLHCPRNPAEVQDDAAGDCPRHQPGPSVRTTVIEAAMCASVRHVPRTQVTIAQRDWPHSL